MFEPPASNHPFLGPSFRLTPTIPTRAQPQARPQLLARNDNLAPKEKFDGPATPQPVAKNDGDITPSGAVRGSKMNVCPPGEKPLMKELKKEYGDTARAYKVGWSIYEKTHSKSG